MSMAASYTATVEDAFVGIDRAALEEIGEKIAQASAAAIKFDQVKALEKSIAEQALDTALEA